MQLARFSIPAAQWGMRVGEKADDNAPGVRIAKVFSGGAAEKAGVKVGDRLLRLDGRWTDNVAALLLPGGGGGEARPLHHRDRFAAGRQKRQIDYYADGRILIHGEGDHFATTCDTTRPKPNWSPVRTGTPSLKTISIIFSL